MAISANNAVSDNKSAGVFFDGNGGIGAIRTHGNIDLSGQTFKGASSTDQKDRFTQSLHAALGNIANEVYTIA